MFAVEIRKKRVHAMRQHTHWRWHLDEVYVKINGEMRYLWRAINHEGQVLESFVRDAGQGCGAEIHQESAEATRPAEGHRNRRTTVIWRRPEGNRLRRSPAHRTLEEQSG